ncbi:MAG: HAD family hydrolase [Defluviitaleaceae bacterium]|nr:HAD family hydrolase [Defluviitaleaceae bacterium]
MKTLYLSDLDGTLLGSDERISEYSASVINRFIQNGGYFSYATARSFVTSSKVSTGLDTSFPVICHNGCFIIDNETNELLLSNYLNSDEISFVSKTLNFHGIYPLVHSYIDGVEKFSYIEEFVTPSMRHFLNKRVGDPRRREVKTTDELYQGSVFCIASMDTKATLSQINDIFDADKRYSCIYHQDIYSKGQWCEIFPAKATKANAALQLKALLGCDKMVVFGDGVNDLSLFAVADEKYAMSNAVLELKEIATAVIDSNDEDGVARWLSRRASNDKP